MPTCRIAYCAKPAADDGELCEDHAREQERRRACVEDEEHTIGHFGVVADPLKMLVHRLRERPTWMDQAACRGLGPDMFFADGRGGHLNRTYDKVRAICDGCPVQQACLAWGWKEEFGVWGGRAPSERAARRRRPLADVTPEC